MNIPKAARARKLNSVALRDAVVSGQSYQVAACLIHNGMDPEGPGSRGGSPLLHAAEAGNGIIVGLLITAGARVNRRSGRLRSTALHAACECHRVEVVRQLLAAGADPRKTNSDRQTPLHSACYGGSATIVTTLLEMGAATANRNNFGATPLSLAVMHGHFDVVKVLLAAGADPDACGTNGDRPLHVASAQGYFKIVVEILFAGAYPSAQHEQTDETPLFIAARAGRVDIVRSLLVAGANPALTTNGWTPLDIATHKAHVSVMREFLQHPGLLTNSDMAYNALRLAAAGGSCESVVILLDAGVGSRFDEPVWSSKQGGLGENEAHTSRLCVTTPIEEARRHGHDDVVRQLERASVEGESEVSAPRETGNDLVAPIAAPLTGTVSTPPEGSGHRRKASTTTGGLVSLLKGEGVCDNAVSPIARERDPERKVRFDVPETPTAEIVEAFPFSPAVAEVYMEESEIVGAFLPPGDAGMPEEDGAEKDRGSIVLPKEQVPRKKAQTLEENIIQWCERVRAVNEQQERLPLLRDGPASSGGRRWSTAPQHEQEAKTLTTVGDDANGRNIPTAAVYREKPKALATEVQQQEKAPAHATVVVESSLKAWSGPDICQDLTNVDTAVWRGIRKTSFLGCWQGMQGAPTGVQGCNDPWTGTSEISPGVMTAAGVLGVLADVA